MASQQEAVPRPKMRRAYIYIDGNALAGVNRSLTQAIQATLNGIAQGKLRFYLSDDEGGGAAGGAGRRLRVFVFLTTANTSALEPALRRELVKAESLFEISDTAADGMHVLTEAFDRWEAAGARGGAVEVLLISDRSFEAELSSLPSRRMREGLQRFLAQAQARAGRGAAGRGRAGELSDARRSRSRSAGWTGTSTPARSAATAAGRTAGPARRRLLDPAPAPRRSAGPGPWPPSPPSSPTTPSTTTPRSYPRRLLPPSPLSAHRSSGSSSGRPREPSPAPPPPAPPPPRERLWVGVEDLRGRVARLELGPGQQTVEALRAALARAGAPDGGPADETLLLAAGRAALLSGPLAAPSSSSSGPVPYPATRPAPTAPHPPPRPAPPLPPPPRSRRPPALPDTRRPSLTPSGPPLPTPMLVFVQFLPSGVSFLTKLNAMPTVQHVKRMGHKLSGVPVDCLRSLGPDGRERADLDAFYLPSELERMGRCLPLDVRPLQSLSVLLRAPGLGEPVRVACDGHLFVRELKAVAEELTGIPAREQVLSTRPAGGTEMEEDLTLAAYEVRDGHSVFVARRAAPGDEGGDVTVAAAWGDLADDEGLSVEFDFPAGATVGDLQRALEGQWGLPAPHQRLFGGGARLDGDPRRPLADAVPPGARELPVIVALDPGPHLPDKVTIFTRAVGGEEVRAHSVPPSAPLRALAPPGGGPWAAVRDGSQEALDLEARVERAGLTHGALLLFRPRGAPTPADARAADAALRQIL
eukprot:tig00021042_g17601.t1